ncbi:MAG: UDP-3-O-(3-hydroxymyristoyl)glucosamine N-acyltransferase [Lentisphaerae bacterium]|nr:UDP-3-O-(3-hydroxymyristoyl)glucosamine N-acyltransferase [Lentisphaerota bacterium]
MPLTVSEIAVMIGGTLEGEGDAWVSGLAGLGEAGADDVTFVSNPKYSAGAARTSAAAVVVSRSWKGVCPRPVIRVEDPDAALAVLAEALGPPVVRPEPGVHTTAVLGANVTVGRDAVIGPHCVVEDGARIGDRSVLWAQCFVGRETEIGEDCLLYPLVSVRERSRIGCRVIVHSGAVVGSDGFGYVREEKGWKKIPQIGTVEIGDDVEIGANVTIDRARFGKTVIESGVKLDNLVQVAHNVRIGENAAIAAQVGVAGSTAVGANVRMGGQSGATGHVEIGDNATVAARGAVTKDVPSGEFVSGYPAMPHARARKLQAAVARLPELRKRVAELEERLSHIEESAKGR